MTNRIRTILVLALLPALLLLGGCEEEEIPETPPRPLPGSPFQYPEELWDAGVEGETVLRVFVTAEGQVDSVRVERPSGHAAFDTAAVHGARELRFEPATRAGEPVGVWRLLPVQFHPDSVDAGARAEP